MGVALPDLLHRVAHELEPRHGLLVSRHGFEAGNIGKPLMMQPRRIHRGLNVHVVIHDIDNDIEHGVDDRAAAGAARDQQHLAVPGHDGRRLRAEHALAGSD